jgi:hypothetical protein
MSTAADVEISLLRTLAANGHISLCLAASYGAGDGCESRTAREDTGGAHADNIKEDALGSSPLVQRSDEASEAEGGGWTQALQEIDAAGSQERRRGDK